MKIEVDDEFIRWLLSLRGPDGLYYSFPAMSELGENWAIGQKINTILRDYKNKYENDYL